MTTRITLTSTTETLEIEFPDVMMTVTFTPKNLLAALAPQTVMSSSSNNLNGHSNYLLSHNGNGTMTRNSRMPGKVFGVDKTNEDDGDMSSEEWDTLDEYCASLDEEASRTDDISERTTLPVADMKRNIVKNLRDVRREILVFVDTKGVVLLNNLLEYFGGEEEGFSRGTMERMLAWLVLEGSLTPGMKSRNAKTWMLTATGENMIHNDVSLEHVSNSTYDMMRVEHALHPRKYESKTGISRTVEEIREMVTGKDEPMTNVQIQTALIDLLSAEHVTYAKNSQGKVAWSLTKNAIR